MRIDEWTKRLGQQHWNIAGKGQTLCGKPMLGNNYAKHIENEDKTCWSSFLLLS
jgi:hypothetical protein